MDKIELRPYQKDSLNAVVKKVQEGKNKLVIVMATGLGKTCVFSTLATTISTKLGGKTLIIAHREELLDQAKDKILRIAPELKVEIEQGERSVLERNYDVIIASVQTLGRSGTKRIKKFNPNEFSFICIDECHHCASESYKRILEYFGVLKGKEFGKGKILLGVTATPSRADHIGLDTIFDEIAYSYCLKDGIKDGYLANIKAFTVFTKEDLSGVGTRMGDFIESELADAVDTEERNRLVVETYLEKVPNTKALVFASSVEHVLNLTEMFQKAGIKAEYVVGETSTEKRKKILEDFKQGKIKVLVNVGCFTEGYDEPTIETIMMARPTKSSVLYQQMVGRGSRRTETKEYFNLVDFVDNTGKNKIVTLPTLFGVPKTLKGNGKMITELYEKAEKILEQRPNYDVENIENWDDESIDKIIKEVDIFAQAELAMEIKEYSKNSWEKLYNGYKLSIPEKDGKKYIIKIAQNLLNQWELSVNTLGKDIPTYRNGFSKWFLMDEKVLYSTPNLEEAFQKGDQYLGISFSEYKTMFNSNAEWRNQPPTDSQLSLLRRFGVFPPKTISKGQCSVLISKILAERRGKY
jgi:ATP-dependent helicase IRC3